MTKKNTSLACLDLTYLATLNAIDEGVLLIDANQFIIYANLAFILTTGYTLDDLQGKSCKVLQGPCTSIQTQAEICAALAAGQTYHGEILNYRKDGAPFWNRLTINPVRDVEGKLTHFVGVLRDISEKKALVAELAIRQELLVLNNEQEMFQRVTDLIIRETDAIGAFITVTEPGKEWFKTSAASADQDDLRADLLALTPSLDPEHLPFGMMLPSRAYREKRPIGPKNPRDHESMRAIQLKHPALDRVQAVMAFPLFVQGQALPAAVLVIDGASVQHFTASVRQLLTQLAITLGVALTQLRHYQAIAEASVFNTRLFNTIGAIAMVINCDGEIVRMNHIAEQFMGCSLDAVKGHPYFWQRFIPENERSHSYTLFEMMHHHTTPPEYESHWVNRLGEKRLFHWISTILNDAGGQAKYLITLGMDITDQKILEQSLQEEAAKNHAFLQYASDGIHILDEQGYLIEVSNQFCIMMGYSCEEMLGMHVSQWNAEKSIDEIRKLLPQHLSIQEPQHFETRHRRKDGSVFDVEISGVVIDLQGKKVLFNSARDITQRKVLEAGLRDNALRLQRLTDFNILIAQVNESISTSLDEQQLLQDVCDLSIRYAHLALAVITRPDASGRFQYLNAAGKTAFLDDLQSSNALASIDPSIPEGRGAYASVWREAQPLFTDSVLSAAFAQPWHERFRHFELKSYAVLPIFRQGQIFGLFVLYHSEENIFDHDLSATLTELGHDISRGLDHIDLMYQERTMFAFNEALLNSLTVGVIVARYPERVIERVNPRTLEIYGASSMADLVGHFGQELFPDTEPYEMVGKFAERVLMEGGGMLHDVPYRRLNGTPIYADLSGQKLLTKAGEPERIVWTLVDVTERHHLMDNLSKQSLSDLLTGLPNRRALDVEMERAIARMGRDEKLLAVCMLDLDDFKPVNDTYGHDAGDRVLQVVAQRLQKTLRKTDLVSRLGGDEFVLLVENLDHLDRLKTILDKVVEVIQAPIALEDGQMVSVGLSMGVSIYPFVEGDHLLRLADQALYKNKSHKVDRLSFWTLYGEQTPQRENLAQKLLHGGGLRVFYQPVLGNHGHTVIGIEALARLQDDDGHILLPAEFLPMLNHDELFELSSRVLEQSLLDLKTLDQNLALWVSVNIDPQNVTDACVIRLRDLIAGGGIAPGRIYLEILEGSNFDDQILALGHLNSLKALGIRLALDDIGSAYSSLLRLKDLPIDKIKLDQGFIRQLEQKPRDLYFVASMLDLANGLNVELVVEGVETEDILDAMMMLGIPNMQGYAIAYPMPYQALRIFLLQVPSYDRTHPASLLGLYAKQLANHNALKKVILQNPLLIDRQTLLDSCACPIHHDLNQLQIPDGHVIHLLHGEYHRAITAMSDLIVITPTTDDWDAVDAAYEALQKAIITEYYARQAISG
jgi:diguanylate cyclase (GGDEF)-like protein/PAS domain S-box-containing protein